MYAPIIGSHRSHTHSIDATIEDQRLGRLVNDDHKHPNCVMKKYYNR